MAWKPVVDLDLGITSLGLLPDYTRSRLIGIRFDWGQYQSDDGGDSWSGMSGQRFDSDFSASVNNVSHGVTSIGISRSEDGFLDYGPIVSTDSGITWSQVTIWANGYFRTTFPIQRNGSTLLAIGEGNSEIALVRSLDDGATWVRIIPPELQVNSSPGGGVLKHGGGQRWFLLYRDNDVVDHFFISEDNGSTWTESNNAPWELLSDITWVSGDIVLAGGKNLAGTVAQLFRSVDGGMNWSAITGPSFTGANGNFYLATGNGVPLAIWSYPFMSTKKNEISRSLDGGATWGALEPNTLLGDFSSLFLLCNRWVVSSGGSYIVEDIEFACAEPVGVDSFALSENANLVSSIEQSPCPCSEEATWVPDVIPSSTFTEVVKNINPY